MWLPACFQWGATRCVGDLPRSPVEVVMSRTCRAPLASCAPLAICALLLLASSMRAAAQAPPNQAQNGSAVEDGTEPPAHVAFVDGAAVLERDGHSDGSPASMPLLAGDRVRTQNGRVEVLFADGSALH